MVYAIIYRVSNILSVVYRISQPSTVSHDGNPQNHENKILWIDGPKFGYIGYIMVYQKGNPILVNSIMVSDFLYTL